MMNSRAARRAFARAWMRRANAGKSPRLGALTLRPAQVRAVERIGAAFVEFGGALLADPPGTGKTIVALAVAARVGGSALVLAPSALRDQWERAARRARVAIRFVAFEAMSRGATAQSPGLVIIDETHHVRTPGTRRYAGVAAACIGSRVLLLTATPVVNKWADRDALLGLFLGAAATTLTADQAARCIVRSAEADGDPDAARPVVQRLRPIQIPPPPTEGAIADALMRLPPPFPAADGSAALALVRVTLAMAWSSSLAALDAALRRRVQRGEALADALEAGRWPTRAALRQWVVGDGATQLVFSALDVASDCVPGDAVTILRAHLVAVRSLRARIAPWIKADAAARADALRALMRRHPTRRLVVFTSHAATVHALWSAMRADGGVVAISGSRSGGTVRAAAGRWSRDDVLRALGSRAAPLPTDPGDPARRDAIRVLLATDMLSEGIEMQGVGMLIHADRPWTPARLEQREGRITRLVLRTRRDTSATQREVFIGTIRAPALATRLLRLGARLRHKERVRARAVRDAGVRSDVEMAIHGWLRAAVTRVTTSRGSAARAPGAFAARLSHERAVHMFLALVRIGDACRLLAGRRRRGRADPRQCRWIVSAAPRLVHEAVQLGDALRQPSAVELRAVRRALAHWARRSNEGALIGPTRDARSPLRQRLHAFVERAMRATPLSSRASRGTELEALVRAVSAAAGAGVERQLMVLLRPGVAIEVVEPGLRAIAAAAQATALLDTERRPATDMPLNSAEPHLERPRPTLVALLVAPAPTPAAARRPATPRHAQTSASP